MSLTLVPRCPISNLSEVFSYNTMYLTFMFLDQFLFELLCKNTHTLYRHKETHTDAVVRSLYKPFKSSLIQHVMAFKPKNWKIFNLTLFQSLVHHGYCRYSYIKLCQGYCMSWLNHVKIWHKFVENGTIFSTAYQFITQI